MIEELLIGEVRKSHAPLANQCQVQVRFDRRAVVERDRDRSTKVPHDVPCGRYRRRLRDCQRTRTAREHRCDHPLLATGGGLLEVQQPSVQLHEPLYHYCRPVRLE